MQCAAKPARVVQDANAVAEAEVIVEAGSQMAIKRMAQRVAEAEIEIPDPYNRTIGEPSGNFLLANKHFGESLVYWW